MSKFKSLVEKHMSSIDVVSKIDVLIGDLSVELDAVEQRLEAVEIALSALATAVNELHDDK